MGLEFKTSPETGCCTGGPGTGKTEALVERAAHLMEGGARPEDILAVAATPDTAAELGRRLRGAAAALGLEGAPEAVSARELALRVLACPDARRRTGRDARILLPFEEKFLIEDLKTTGVAPKRLREMLKFLHRSLTELADDDPSWLYSEEEELVVSTMRARLGATRSTMEPEAANLAVKSLRADIAEGGRPEVSFEHVLADDFSLMSGASQVLCSLVARASFWAAGNPDASGARALDSYPYAEGLRALGNLPGVELVELDGGGSAGHAPVERHAYETPEEEIAAEADLVAGLVEQGLAPGEVYLASQSRRWRQALCRALAERRVAAAMVTDPGALSSDERDLDACGAARALTALGLAADPASPLAWRAWCGFGDYLLGSRAFMEAPGGPSGAGQAAESDRQAAAADLARVERARRSMESFLKEAAGLRGPGLVDAVLALCRADGAVSARDEALLRDLCSPVGTHDAAGELLGRALKLLELPAFRPVAGGARGGEGGAEGEDGGGRVRVGSLAQLAGLRPEVVVMSGMVNGLFPEDALFDPEKATNDQRDKIRERDARLMREAAAKARGTLHAGWFRQAPLHEALQLKVHIDKIGLAGGQRHAFVSPSVMLDELG